MRYNKPRLVWTSLPIARGRGILCERRVARRRGACEGACEEECEPNPKPRPKPNPSSADIGAERGVASIGVRSSGNLCGLFVFVDVYFTIAWASGRP